MMAPDERSLDKLEFELAPKMPIGTRLTWVAGLLIAGLLIQWTFSLFLGWLLILAGCVLAVIRSRTIAPDVPEGGSWQSTTMEELTNIRTLSNRIEKWRGQTGAFNVTSSLGCAGLAGALAVIAVIAVLLAVTVDLKPYSSTSPETLLRSPFRGGSVFPIWVIDALTMLIPVWFAGWLKSWEPPDLLRKVSYMLTLYSTYKNHPELEFLPSLYVSPDEDRSVPRDCRMLVRVKDAPKEFIGIQVQISMNKVQSTKYPYCYSVIIAKPEFGLRDKVRPYLALPEVGFLKGLFSKASERKEMSLSQFEGCVAEVTSEKDVDVVVIRQVTTGTGYHTTEAQAMSVFSRALDLAKLVLK